MQLAYAHLNLRRNPFGEPPLDALHELIVWEDLDAVTRTLRQVLATPGTRCTVQFVGACGRGKSGRMRALHARFPKTPWLYFAAHEPHPKLPDLATTPLLFLDETQRLPWWTRQRLWRSPASLVIGTHRDHRTEWFARQREFVHIQVEQLDALHLEAIVTRRIAWAVRDPRRPPGIQPSDELIEALLTRHGSDLRAILATLYELVQQMSTPGLIPMPDAFDLSHIEPSGHLPRNQTRHTFTKAPRSIAYD